MDIQDWIKTKLLRRWGIRFTGVVQGVRFDPVTMWAHQARGLSGFVYNDSSGVYVEAQSDIDTLQLFVDTIQEEQPRLCRITHVSITGDRL
ncbi:MAG: acylphosphatase [Veillonella atypica]